VIDIKGKDCNYLCTCIRLDVTFYIPADAEESAVVTGDKATDVLYNARGP
jgi:hypothetical protein